MPINNGKTMEQIFVEIARNHGAAIQNGKMLVSVFCDLSQNTQDQRLVRYFAECDGPAELLAAQSLSPVMQQARFQQTVNKISAKTLIPEESARRVCNAFWWATGGKSMIKSKEPFQQEMPVQKAAIIQQAKPTPTPTPPMRETVQQAPSEIRGGFNYFDKVKYYISQEEAARGGQIAVYYKTDKLYIDIPPNTKEKHQVRPVAQVCILDSKKCTFHEGKAYWEKNYDDYSDGLIEARINQSIMYILKDSYVGSTVCLLLGYPGVLLATGAVFLYNLVLHGEGSMPGILWEFSSIKQAVFSVLSVAWWTWPLILQLLEFATDLKAELDLQKGLRAYLQKRKKLPVRPPRCY